MPAAPLRLGIAVAILLASRAAGYPQDASKADCSLLFSQTPPEPPEQLHVLQCGESLASVNALTLANAAWAARHGYSYTFDAGGVPGRVAPWCKIRLLHATLRHLVLTRQHAVVLFLDNDAVVAAEGAFTGAWLRGQGHSVAAPLDDGDDIGDEMSDRLRNVFHVDPSTTTQALREDLLRRSATFSRGTLTHDLFNTGIILADASSESVAFFSRLWEEGTTWQDGAFLHAKFAEQRIFNLLAGRYAGTPDQHFVGLLPGREYNSAATDACIRHFYAGRLDLIKGDDLATLAHTKLSFLGAGHRRNQSHSSLTVHTL